MDSSLTQALFDDLKGSLGKDMVSAIKGLQKVLANSGHLEAYFKEALEGLQADRMTLYSSCITTIIVAVSCVIVIGMMWCHVVSKVNSLMEVMSACEERIPLTQPSNRQPIQTTSFNHGWMEPTPPSNLRALKKVKTATQLCYS